MEKQIILCGAGKVGRQLFENIGAENVFCFADNYKAGQTFCGKSVITLEEIQKVATNYKVILSVGFALANELSEQLTKLGIHFTNGIYYLRQCLLSKGEFKHIESEGIFTSMFVAFCKNIKPHSFANLGAAEGGYTSIAAYFMPNDAKIYAFEPIAKYYDGLSKIFFDDKRVEVIKKAVSNQIGKLDLFAAVKPGASSIVHSFTFDQDQTMFKDEYNDECEKVVETVDTITLDTFCENKDIDLVLMDIEGAELFAVDGMKQLIAKGKTTFFLELHEPYIRAVRSDGVAYISKIFTENGYKIYWCEYESDNYDVTRGGKSIKPVSHLKFEHCIIVSESFTAFDTLLAGL